MIRPRPQLADGHLDEARRGVRARQVDRDSGSGSHGADAQLPVPAGVAADQRRGRVAGRQRDEVLRARFAGIVAADLDPGVLEDRRLQLAARAMIGSIAGSSQRWATQSLIPTIGPSRTQRSISRTLASTWFGLT